MHVLVRSQALFLAIVEHFSGEVSKDGGAQWAAVGDDLTVELVREGDVAFIDAHEQTNSAFLTEACPPDAPPGMRALWLNQTGKPALGEMPLHDAELMELEGLRDALQGLGEKPGLAQIFDWWEEWELPDNVRAHCVTVAWAAYALGVLLRQQGMPVDPILAHRGGLVHDLDKIRTLHLKGAHGVLGAEFLAGQGYPLLTKIVREHIMHTILKADAADRRWENKLVYFCDKCVEGDQIVTFDQRLEKLRRRYPQYQESMRLAEDPIWALSDQICSLLGMASHDAMIAMLKHLRTQTSD